MAAEGRTFRGRGTKPMASSSRGRGRSGRVNQNGRRENGPPRREDIGKHRQRFNGAVPDGSMAEAGPSRPKAQKRETEADAKSKKKSGDDDDEDEPEADVPIFERTSLSLASNPLPPISALAATLSQFKNLHRLDMSFMQPSMSANDDSSEESSPYGLTSLRFIETAQLQAEKEQRKSIKAAAKGMSPESDRNGASRKTLKESLTWLNLTGNTSLGGSHASEDCFRGLHCLENLVVLNLSSCSLTRLPPRSAWYSMSHNLKALVLSHNRLDDEALQSLPYLPEINSLILSNNRIKQLPRSLPANLPNLAKLSLSHNALGDGPDSEDSDDEEGDSDSDSSDHGASDKGTVALPDFTMNVALREVRLAHNASLNHLPSHAKTWGQGRGQGEAKRGRGLDLLDLGHCGLTWSNVNDVLLSAVDQPERPRGLKNLNLTGNAGIEDEEGYKEAVKEALPSLIVLDNQRIAEKRKGKAAKADAIRGSPEKGESEELETLEDEAQSSSASLSKKRKRGGRGGAKGHSEEDECALLRARAGPAPDDAEDDEAAEVASDDEAVAPQQPKFEPAPSTGKRGKRGDKKKKQKRQEEKEDEEEWLAHTRAARGGDDEDTEETEVQAADGEAKGKRNGKKAAHKDRSAEKTHKTRKSKGDQPAPTAWDEERGSRGQQGASEDAKTESAVPSTTSSAGVAGIVEVKTGKKKSQPSKDSSNDKAAEAQKPAPSWTSASKADSLFGMGGGGGDSSWLGSGGTNSWG
ncbi:unnamed protein product [Jaminaea pallidilutea]